MIFVEEKKRLPRIESSIEYRGFSPIKYVIKRVTKMGLFGPFW